VLLINLFRGGANGKKRKGVEALLPNLVIPSFLNWDKIVTRKDNLKINPDFGLLSSRAVQTVSDMLGYLV